MKLQRTNTILLIPMRSEGHRFMGWGNALFADDARVKYLVWDHFKAENTMQNYKTLFGYAAILFGLGFLVRSFMPAHAFNGPTVSTGANPIKNF